LRGVAWWQQTPLRTVTVCHGEITDFRRSFNCGGGIGSYVFQRCGQSSWVSSQLFTHMLLSWASINRSLKRIKPRLLTQNSTGSRWQAIDHCPVHLFVFSHLPSSTAWVERVVIPVDVFWSSLVRQPSLMVSQATTKLWLQLRIISVHLDTQASGLENRATCYLDDMLTFDLMWTSLLDHVCCHRDSIILSAKMDHNGVL
jgi:hypothetical protein